MARDEVGWRVLGDGTSSRPSMDEVLRALAAPDSRLEPTVREVASPLGTLRLAAADGWLCLAEFIGSESHWGAVCDRIALRLGWRFGSRYHTDCGDRAVLDAAARQLKEYFAASRTEFKLHMDAGTTPERAGVAVVAAQSAGATPHVRTDSRGDRPAARRRLRRSGGRPKPADDHHSLPSGRARAHPPTDA